MQSADNQVQVLADQGRRAQAGWAAIPFRERARRLRRLASRLRADEELVRIISAETGKPAFEAFAFEVAYVGELVRFLGGRQGRAALAEQSRSSLIFPHKRARVAWQPRGLVAVIGPSNFPLLNNFADALVPLLAGNSVLLKPSPHTPQTSLRVEALWREVGLPEHVFQVVLGGPELGSAMVEACDMVFFTGSMDSGRRVAARAGERLVPCVAELGGNSAMIVLADADVSAAARAAVWGAFVGSGQVCIRVERVLVESQIADAFVRAVVAETAKLRLGAGAGVDMGPVLLASQVERYRRQIDDAVARGARILTGGGPCADLGDRFFAPTVLDGVPADAAVACEETFGPLLPIVRVADAEEALRLSNDSSLGLSGSIWSRDEVRAMALARRLAAGSVCINDVLVNYFVVAAPFGAARGGGLGFRHGPEALRQFCHPQTVVHDRPVLRPLARWVRKQLGFPYRQRVLDVLRWLTRAIYR